MKRNLIDRKAGQYVTCVTPYCNELTEGRRYRVLASTGDKCLRYSDVIGQRGANIKNDNGTVIFILKDKHCAYAEWK